MLSSIAWLQKVAIEYRFGVMRGSMPIFDLRNNGADAEMNVGRVECISAVGAREKGSVQLGSVLILAMMERGGCVEGVSMCFVRAISRGASIVPAMPAADTATASEARGDGDERMSSPPV